MDDIDERSASDQDDTATEVASPQQQETAQDEFKTLKYSLLGPSLTKAGQDKVDQSKVSEIIYNASKGSKFFNREEERDKVLTEKIAHILARRADLESQDLSQDLRQADRLFAELEMTRDLSQHVVHIDCDAFYAAVEQLERPELKDVPFAVGGGVLTTCNYLARQFGCRSGMAGFVAKKLCPSLVFIRPNFQKYTAKAQEVREILAEYDPRFESASIDEAYLNITEYCRDHDVGPADAIEEMRRIVHEKTNITVSAGIAANTKLAKICSNMNKPNGQYLLPKDRNAIMTFMRDLPTRKVNGIGRVLERELLEIGVKTCGDIYEKRQYLNKLFGEKTAEFLAACYLGLGRTKVQPAEEYERKSVGTESTFREMSNPERLREKLRWTAEELEKDMARAECKGRTLCLKVKLHTFEVLTRQVITPRAVCLADDLYNFALPMLAKLEQEMPNMKLRLMGLRCTHLVSTKKVDSMAFFGFKKRKQYSTDLPGNEPTRGDGTETSQCIDSPELVGRNDDDHRQVDTPPSLVGGEQSMFGHHGKEILPNPRKQEAEPEENWWECPVCLRPQQADERLFNEHIDLCLSRQTIREAVHERESVVTKPTPSEAKHTPPEAKRPRLGDKKRGKPVHDPKQKKLSFT